MSIQLSPGVNIVEKDFTQIVPTVSTSTGAIAGPFKWGPVEQPILVTSESDLIAAFGQPTPDCYSTFYIAKNFLDYSKMMYATRTDSSTGRNAVSQQSGRISKITVTTPGAGFTQPPQIAIESPAIPGGVPATVAVRLAGGRISSIAIENGGTGYTEGDIIEFSQPEVPQETFDSNGILIESVYSAAIGRVGAVSETGAILSVIVQSDVPGAITSPGAGYINANTITYTILNPTGTANTSGSGAILSANLQKSGIRDITIVNGGSGYTLDQLPLSFTLSPAEEDIESNYITPVLSIDVVVSGTKIKNAEHYESSFSRGQGTYGEFAAKYPGVLGNGISVSMCDRDNWSVPVFGEFFARKSIEPNENQRELLIVRRVVGTDEVFENDALDSGKILRTTSGSLIGEIDRVESETYYKITLEADSKLPITDGMYFKRAAYSAKHKVIGFYRKNQDVTLTTVTPHGFKVGDFIDADIQEQKAGAAQFTTRGGVSNIGTNAAHSAIKFKVIAVTENTLTYAIPPTHVFPNPVVSATAAQLGNNSYVQSTAQGYFDGFVKEYDAENDEYILSKRSFYIKTAPNFDLRIGNIIGNTTSSSVNTNGRIGIIANIERVQNIILSTAQSASANDVYGAACVAEWKYKSQFGAKAPLTSAFTQAAGGVNDELHIIVLNNAGTIIEKYESVSKASDAKDSSGKSIYYKNVINSTSKWLWSLDHPINLEEDSSKADWGTPAAASNYKSMTNAITRKLSGGVDGNTASAGHYLNAYAMFADQTTYDVSLFPLDYMGVSTIKSIITSVIEKRRDCIACVTPPLYVGNTMRIAQDIVKYRNEIGSSSYAIMGSGWKYQYDKYSDEFRWIPLTGDIAGLCAYTDAIADPWFSPAGFNRGQIKNVIKLSFNPTLEQRDVLYSSGVNPVVTFPAEGTVLYGDKTLQTKASAFDRINVRRLFIVLEKSIALASKYQLFEYNDDFTRAQFRSMTEPYLRDIQGRRGITDFLVKCDTSNNTPEVIDRNEFIADIYIKPARSINFITLNFIATKTGISFDEIAG